jgi:hypothetical protein
MQTISVAFNKQSREQLICCKMITVNTGSVVWYATLLLATWARSSPTNIHQEGKVR